MMGRRVKSFVMPTEKRLVLTLANRGCTVRRMELTKEQAEEIYAILQEECGECDLPDHRERDSFVRYMTSGERSLEYRFQGALGFGGKCRLNSNHPIPYVDYYPEDYTVERENMRDRANERIAALFAAEVPNV
jgi:hypothetical protein